MIVRIATEGQYEIDGAQTDEMTRLDQAAVAACENQDEAAFRAAYDRLLEFVRTKGRPVQDDVLAGSDLILPPPDVTLEEAKAEFSGEGLLPS
jgi:hypothetical protein